MHPGDDGDDGARSSLDKVSGDALQAQEQERRKKKEAIVKGDKSLKVALMPKQRSAPDTSEEVKREASKNIQLSEEVKCQANEKIQLRGALQA